MRVILIVLTFIISIAFSSCEHGDYHDSWSRPDKKVWVGKYERNLEVVENGPFEEFIELRGDGTFHYYSRDALNTISVEGTYFLDLDSGNEHYCYIELNGIDFPFPKSDDDPRLRSGLKTAHIYGISGNEAFIDISPENEADAFILKR